MKEAQMEIKDDPLPSPIYIRCAKAACILYLLRSSSNRRFKASTDGQDEEKDRMICEFKASSDDQDEEKHLMVKQVEDLKVKLARERIRSKRIKICSVMELVLQILVALSVSTVVLMLAFNIK